MKKNNSLDYILSEEFQEELEEFEKKFEEADKNVKEVDPEAWAWSRLYLNQFICLACRKLDIIYTCSRCFEMQERYSDLIDEYLKREDKK